MFTFARIIFVFLLVSPVSQVCAQAAVEATKEPMRWRTGLNLDRVDLNTLQRRLAFFGLKIPVKASGLASVRLKAAIPVMSLRKSSAYQIEGDILIQNLKLDQATFETLTAKMRFDEGVLTLDDLILKQQDGVLRGSARMELDPSEQFEASLKIESFDAGPTMKLVEKLEFVGESSDWRGKVNAKIEASGNTSEIENVSKWNIDGTASIKGLQRADSIPISVAIESLKLKDEVFSFDGISLKSVERESLFVRGSATGSLGQQPELSANLQANDFLFEDFFDLVSPRRLKPVKGKLDFAGQLSISPGAGQDSLPNLSFEAAVASPRMFVMGIDFGLIEHDLTFDNDTLSLRPRRDPGDTPLQLNEMHARFEVNDESFRAREVLLEAFGGAIEGHFRWSRVAESDHEAEFRWRELSPKVRLEVAGNPVRLTAALSGGLSGTAMPECWNSRGLIEQSLVPSSHRSGSTTRVSVRSASTPRPPRA